MTNTLQTILDWSEVWSLFIPLIVLLIFPKQPHILKPVIIYLWLALIINLTGNILGDYGKELGLPSWLQRNTFLYNTHSILRFACFSYFFLLLAQPFLTSLKKVVPFLSLLFVIINFTFFEPFNSENHLSGRLLATEAFLLLLYCLQYYLYKINQDVGLPKREADFWVVTGLSMYVVINFFVFLFYVSMISKDISFAEKMWDVHNIAYIILNIFIAKAFYDTNRNPY